MSSAKLTNGDAAIAAAQLERRLARSTLFADENPHLRTVPTTSNPGRFCRLPVWDALGMRCQCRIRHRAGGPLLTHPAPPRSRSPAGLLLLRLLRRHVHGKFGAGCAALHDWRPCFRAWGGLHALRAAALKSPRQALPTPACRFLPAPPLPRLFPALLMSANTGTADRMDPEGWGAHGVRVLLHVWSPGE